MLGESRDVVGEEEVGGRRDEESKAIGVDNAATAGVAGATLCVDVWPVGHRFVRRNGAYISSRTPTGL